MGWLKKTVDENCLRKPDSTEMPLLLEDSPTMKTQEGEGKEVNKGNQITESPQKSKKVDRQERTPHSLISKTGFRICRPVGSFSWPKLPALAAATDTATVLSSSHAEFASPPCPVKPLAAKRPLVLPFPFAVVTSPEAHTNLFNL